jgi:Arc/MetJ-type ribon-helix-helix transcriptional regulator
VRMARPKKFARRIMVRFPEETLAAIESVIGDTEDRSDFIRAAVELATAIRKIDVYDDLKAHLMASETIEDFCAKAVRQAVRRRKATLAKDEGNGEIGPAAE